MIKKWSKLKRKIRKRNQNIGESIQVITPESLKKLEYFNITT